MAEEKAERFNPSYPTRDPDPDYDVPENPDCCGNCASWKRMNPKAPFGQCVRAIQWLGAPMYTPDLAGCTLPQGEKDKGMVR